MNGARQENDHVENELQRDDDDAVMSEGAEGQNSVKDGNVTADQTKPVVAVEQAVWDKLQNDLADYKDRYVRLYAEFDNVRKRNEREKLEFVKYASEQLIIEFLAILDNLELSLNAAKDKHEDYEAFIKGVEMVMTHIYGMLKKNGVKQVEAEGKRFDPNCHEVLMQEPRDGVEDGTVIGVFQKGYCLHDKVIRTAKVKLASCGQPEVE